MTTKTILTPEQVDSLLEGVLRASGSSLSNYTMRMGVEQMRGAIRAIEQAVLQSSEVQRLKAIETAAGKVLSMPREDEYIVLTIHLDALRAAMEQK